MRLLRALPALIFGLAFAAGGVFFLFQTAVPTWQDWRAMQGWQSAYAQLVSVSGSENQTNARYRYDFDGVTYEGERVYVPAFNDNIGSYHTKLLGRLQRHERAHEPVQVWVNPQDPTQAVIDRDMRWGLFALMTVFCSVFILIGLGVMYGGSRASDKQRTPARPSLIQLRREWKQKSQDPDFTANFLEYAKERASEYDQQPVNESKRLDWHLRKGWGTSTIRSEAKRGLIAIWGFAIVWNAISSPVLFAFPKELARSNYAVLIGLLFPLVGLYLLYQALRATNEYRRFGVVLFEMDPYPGGIGGNVGGRIVLSRLDYATATAPSSKLSVRLECVYSYVSGSGDNRSRSESIKWVEEGVPQIEGAGQGVTLGFRFTVPDNLPEADVEQSGNYHFWRLNVTGDIPGVDLNRQFNIPVYSTGETSRSASHDLSAQAAEHRQQASEATRQSIMQGRLDLPGLTRAMHYSDYGGEISMAFPMFRDKLLTVFAGIFAGGFGFASYQMIRMAIKGKAFGIFVGLFSVPFVLVAIVATIATVYLLFNNLRVRIARNEITVLRRMLFIPVFFRRLKVTDISSVSIKYTGSTGQGLKQIKHFKVLARDRKGGTVTLAEDIDGEDIAGYFRDYLAGRLNVEARVEPQQRKAWA